MVEHDQINVRVPDAAKPTIKDIAERLRRDTSFLPRLRRWLEEEGNDGRSAFLADRIDKLEARMAELARRLDGGSAPRNQAAPRQVEMFDAGSDERSVAVAPIEASSWTIGEGRGRRLTEAGKEEMRRRVQAGETDRTISEFLGVRPFSVAQFRKVSKPQS